MKLLDPFFRFHPGADIAENLFREKEFLINNIIRDPSVGLDLISEKYKFGNKSDFWDDHIFLMVIAPALTEICSLVDLRLAINKYSELDHSLFLRYIRRDEEPVRFRRAFWNVNSYGKQLSERFMDEFCHAKNIKKFPYENKLLNDFSAKKVYKLAFVFKGKFALAHAEFLHEFLRGSKFFVSQVKITLILLDDTSSCLRNSGVDHIRVVSFRKGDTYETLNRYYAFAHSEKFDHISWVACVQNLSLYMGQRLSSSQSYWSMKYHSIIMNSLDKYAGLGFGGDSFEFDDIKWFRGRAFPDLSLPPCNSKKLNHFKDVFKIPDNSVIAGCFVRSEKLNNPQYWQLIARLLDECPDLHFVIASQSLPDIANTYLQVPSFRQKFHHLGWVNTKEWCQNLDIYFDSFPRGSCLTALEAIKAHVPVVMFDSKHNRESSALPYLISAGAGKIPPGVFSCDNVFSLYEKLKSLLLSESERNEISSYQFKLLQSLEGMSILYAKDYLNYFLGTTFSIRKVEDQ